MWNGKFWALTTVDSTLGTGKFNSIAVDSKGHPHIAYADRELRERQPAVCLLERRILENRNPGGSGT